MVEKADDDEGRLAVVRHVVEADDVAKVYRRHVKRLRVDAPNHLEADPRNGSERPPQNRSNG